MKNLLQKLHIYGGLIFFPYLLIFGLSTLYINHDFKIFREKQDWTVRKMVIDIADIEDNQQLAESIRDSLELMGWCPWWIQNRDESQFRFSIDHFGSEHRINANLGTGELIVNRRNKGFWSVLHSLHFLGSDVPRANKVINSWQYYQDFTVIYLIIAIITGVYMFLESKKEKKTGILILGGFFGASLTFIIYVCRCRHAR